jgi:hypothetical protein
MRLDEAITHHFDTAGLAALAAELDVEWAELPGATAKARAAALVTALGEAGRATELIAALAERRPKVRWAELPYPRETLNALHADLVRRHNVDGLRSVCFRLGVDFDDLPGEGKDGRARELVLALDRQGRAAELWMSDELRVTSYEFRRRLTPRTPSAPRTQRKNVLLGELRALGVLGVSFLTRISYFVSRISLNSSGDRSRLVVTRNSSLVLALLLLLAIGWRLAADRGRATADSAPTAIAAETTGVATPAAPSEATEAPRVLRPILGTPKAALLAGVGGLATPTATATATTLAPTPSPTASPTAVARTLLEVGWRGANLRRGPGPQYDVVATLRAGALLEAVGVSPSGEWIQVRLPGKGWPWIDVRYAVLPEGATLPAATYVASAATPAPEPATPTPIATAAATAFATWSWPPYTPPNPPLPPTPLPTRPPRPTSSPPIWSLTPTSPPP